jgi:hypothetical protein
VAALLIANLENPALCIDNDLAQRLEQQFELRSGRAGPLQSNDCFFDSCTHGLDASVGNLARRPLCQRLLFLGRNFLESAFGMVTAARLPQSLRLIRTASAWSKRCADASFAAAAFMSRDAVVRCLKPSRSALARNHCTHSPWDIERFFELASVPLADDI